MSNPDSCLCQAQHADAESDTLFWRCTRCPGHTGDHVTELPTGEEVARWPDEE